MLSTFGNFQRFIRTPYHGQFKHKLSKIFLTWFHFLDHLGEVRLSSCFDWQQVFKCVVDTYETIKINDMSPTSPVFNTEESVRLRFDSK